MNQSRPISSFADIHSHDQTRATAGDTLVSISPSAPMLPGGWYSVGIHPWDTADAPPSLSVLKELVRRARLPQVVAIGECGIDNLRGASPSAQARVFAFHARLAERVGKPLVIHAVRSYPALIALRRRLKPRQRWIIHGFRGNPTLAAELLRHGFDLSLGHRHHPALPGDIIPPDRLFHESDAPARQ